MKRMTRRSSIFSIPTANVLEEKPITGSVFDTKFSVRSFTRIVDKLTEDQREAITRTGFGSLLNIHNQMNSKVLLGELMERWNIENNTFELLHGEATITPQDVALILGLRVIGKPVVRKRPFSNLEQEYGATPHDRAISISSIEGRLESMGGLVNKDFVRSFLLLTFGVLLFPNSSGKVDSDFLTYLEDLDNVHEYAWGEAVRQDLFSWIKIRKETNVKLVGGCLLLLQVWFYEHIDLGRPNLLPTEQYPRASRWESIRSTWPRQRWSNEINNLQKDQITWVLHPTTRELEIDVVKQIVEAESAKEEETVGQASASSSAVSECDDDSEACHPETVEVIPFECAMNEDLDKEAQFRQEIASDATSEIPVSCLETEEMVESEWRKRPEKGTHVDEELISEASSPCLEMPAGKSESLATPTCSRVLEDEDEDEECVESISQELSSLQLQDVKELEKEIVMLRERVSLLAELQAENAKLKEENSDLKAKNEDLTKQKNEMESIFVDISTLAFGTNF